MRKISKKRRLTPKQQAFCDYYITTGDATESARRAGYSKRTASEIGYENLNKPHLAEYIRERNEVLEGDRIADMEEVHTFWSRILRDDQQEVRDRLRASEFIARTNAAFIDKQNIEHSGGVDIKVEWGNDEN